MGRKTFVNSFPLTVKSLFCTEKIESIEWKDLEQRQRTGDCLLIHPPRWGLCDQPLSSHQVALRQCVFCKEPLSFWFASKLRNLGLLGSECECCACLILLPLLQDVPSLIPENHVRVQASLPPDLLCTPSTTQEYLPTGHPHSCHPSFYFGFGFLRIPAPVSWWLVRHLAQILNLKMNSKQLCFQRLVLLLFSTSPVIALWRTNCFQNWRITLERQEVRKCPSSMGVHFSSSSQHYCRVSGPLYCVHLFWASFFFCSSCASVLLNRLRIPSTSTCRNDICCQKHILFQTCNSDTREDAQIYMTGFTIFLSAQDLTSFVRAFISVAFFTVNLCLQIVVREKTIVLFVSDYWHCCQRLFCHDWNCMSPLWNTVHVLSTENTLPLSSQR